MADIVESFKIGLENIDSGEVLASANIVSKDGEYTPKIMEYIKESACELVGNYLDDLREQEMYDEAELEAHIAVIEAVEKDIDKCETPDDVSRVLWDMESKIDDDYQITCEYDCVHVVK